MSQTRKTFFSRTVNHPGAVAVLLNTLMVAEGWAETDSREGGQCILLPASATLYIGDDEDVRDADGAGVYRGFPVASGTSLNLAEYRYCGALIDPNSTWLYSVGAQDIAVLFQGL